MYELANVIVEAKKTLEEDSATDEQIRPTKRWCTEERNVR
jgi:hypothetical protein